ncbi:MAG: response regulator [Lentisphaerae bacterium]|nr:response regulator [Lentisphaerota bacterium]
MSRKHHGTLHPCAPRRILVVDDQKSIRDMFYRVLLCKTTGFPNVKLDLAVNGAEAVESFRTLRQGVILMDLNMPVMDGEQAYRQICEICHAQGIEKPHLIFFTGYDPQPAIVKLVEENAHCTLLRKPISRNALIEALRIQLPHQP